MKKKTNFLLVVLLLLCIAAFIGYRALDAMRTDSQAPEIQIGDQIPEISVNDPEEALLQGIHATDVRDGDVTGSVVVENIAILDSTGRIQVSYAAFDKAGNVAKAQREALYIDYVSPRFTLSAPLLYRSGVNFDVLKTVGATDLIDGDIQHRVRATSLDDSIISTPGTHNVQFQVSNSLGDITTVVLPVEVYETMNYTATLSLNTYLVYLRTGEKFNPNHYLDTFTLAGTKTLLDGRLPNGYSLQTVGELHTDTPGVYPLQYFLTYTETSATNSQYSREYTAYSKLIVIVEG